MGVGVFARLQHTPGIRQWDPRAENWVLICASIWDPQSESGSRSPAIAFRKWEACATARSVPRGSDACHNCSIALSLRAPVQERSPCPSVLLLELRPNALLPEFIRSSASLRIRWRSSCFAFLLLIQCRERPER